MANRDTTPAYWQGDMLWFILATGTRSNGHYSLIGLVCRQGSRPAPHQYEALYLLDIEADVAVGDQRVEAKVGSLMFIPRHTSHNFRIAQWLNY